MLRFYKFIVTFVLIFTVLGARVAESQQTQNKNWMFALHLTENTEKFVEIMINDETCAVIATALNQWAVTPPITPLKFYCKPEPVRV